MTPIKASLAVLAAAASLAAFPATAAQDGASDPFFGVWANPKGSVQVDIRPCGQGGACGYVVWATAKAQEDARKGGTPNLIGLQIFRELRQDASGAWNGKVFAPDLGMTFAGSAKLAPVGALKAKGCVLGGLICKSQTWRRAERRQAAA